MSDQKYVFHVARECSDIIGAGGVGDVVLQLAKKCAYENYKTTIIIPCYSPLTKLLDNPAKYKSDMFSIPMKYENNRLRQEEVKMHTFQNYLGNNLSLCLIDAERFRNKNHPYVYTKSEEEDFINTKNNGVEKFCGAERPPENKVIKGVGHYDYFAMNILLQKSALKYVKEILKPEGKIIIHGHDAHAASIPLIAKYNTEDLNYTHEKITYVVTAHNCGYAYRQQIEDVSFASSILGVDENELLKCMIDGAFDPFGATILHSDSINTVSEGYAWEIEQGAYSDWISAIDEDLKGFCKFLKLNKKKIVGITNGIDPSIKGPENLSGLFSSLNIKASNIPDNFSWKIDFKKLFVEERLKNVLNNWRINPEKVMGNLKNFNPDNPLFTFVGRLTNQKAPDIIFRAIEESFSFYKNIGFCILGDSEEERIQQKIEEIKNRFEGRVIIITGFNTKLADEIYAAGDFFLIPSKFEPCGLIDLIAQLNGNIPIANQVGGLSKVINGQTGIGYLGLNDRENLRGLVDSIHKSVDIFYDKILLNKMREAANKYVRNNLTWNSVFPEYEKLYKL